MRQPDILPQPPATPPASSVRGRFVATMLRPSVLLPAITLLALALRLYKLGYRDYFDDEVITTFVARLPPAEIFRSVMVNDTHPPLYHLLLHFWLVFGDGLTTIRLFSVAISVACVPLVYLLGRELAARPVALTAAGIMAISPFQIYHGQQARMYPLLALVVLVAALLFVYAWRKGGPWRWLWFGLSVAAGFYTHVYFVFSLLALDLWALLESYRHRPFQKRRWAGLLAAQALGGLAFLPFLPQMLGTVRGVIRSFWVVDTPFSGLLALISLSNNADIIILQGMRTPIWYLLSAVGLLVVLLTTVYSLREARRHPGERTAWALLHLLVWVPIVLATLISLTIRPILVDRSLIGVAAPLYLLMAWMAVRLGRHPATWIAALAFAAGIAVSLTYTYPDSFTQNDLIRMEDYLAAAQRPGDAIAYADWQSFDTAVLTHPQQQDVYVLPGPWLDRSYWSARVAVMRWHSPQNVQPVADFAPRYRRVWLVLTLYTYDLDYHQQVNQGWLERHGRLVQRLDFERAALFLYELAPQLTAHP